MSMRPFITFERSEKEPVTLNVRYISAIHTYNPLVPEEDSTHSRIVMTNGEAYNVEAQPNEIVERIARFWTAV